MLNGQPFYNIQHVINFSILYFTFNYSTYYCHQSLTV